MKQRVVITGMGVITSLGQDLNTLWDNLMAGKSGVSEIEAFDTSEYTTKIAASIKDFNPEDYIERKDARKNGSFCTICCCRQ